MASAGARQQATLVQDSLQPEATPRNTTATPSASRDIFAQADNAAAVSEIESVSQEQQDKQDKQDEQNETEQQASATSKSGTPEAAAHTNESLPMPSPDAAAEEPAAVGAMRGVLFRIFPPMSTTLPAEIAIAGPVSALNVPQVNAASAATGLASPPAQVSPEAIASEPVPAGQVLPEQISPGLVSPGQASPGQASPGQVSPGQSLEQSQLRPSYLLGTIHFGTPEEQGVDYAILAKALADVDTFVNEADLDEAWKPDYDDYRWLSPTQPLSRMVSKVSYARARSLLPGIRVQDLLRMKPWSVLALLEARGETGGNTTMDARLQRMATAAGKRLVHLETLQQQLQALDCVPATEHALVLDERLHAPWILRDESAAAMGYYRSRNLHAWLADIDRMNGLSDAGKAIEQRSRHCLLEDRNARWVGQLETLFQDGPSFVAVGAVHLVGAEGLLEVLRRDGYRIEEVPL